MTAYTQRLRQTNPKKTKEQTMTTETMNAQQLAKIINVPLFADRGTDLEAAFTEFHAAIKRLPARDQVATLTAVHVMLNTISNILKAE
jgi:hypothetical protein